MYLSAFCGMLDFSTEKLIYSNYGHPSQYVYRIHQNKILELSSQTTLLGIGELGPSEIHETEIPYQKGDLLLLFTDGITETRNAHEEEFGTERLKDFLVRNAEFEHDRINQRLMEELNGFKMGGFRDDIFIMSIKIH